MPDTDLDDLVNTYTRLCIAYGELYRRWSGIDSEKYNPTMLELISLRDKIRKHRIDGSRRMAPLMEHDNPWVRLMSATDLLDDYPSQAIAVLKILAVSSDVQLSWFARRELISVAS